MAGKRIRRVAAVVVLLAIIAGAVATWRHLREKEHPEEFVLYGNVDIREIELAFNGTQRIEKMLKTEGDRVKAGELLGVLDTSRLLPMVQQARAQAEAQQAVVDRLLAGSRPEEVRKAKADVAAAQAAADQAKILYERTVTTWKLSAATDQELTDAKAGAEGTEARLRAAQETLALVVEGPRKEDIAGAQAALRAANANLALLEAQLADARLLAPSDAVVRVRVAEPGDMASPAKPAYVLAVTDPLWVRVYVDEPDRGRIREGLPAAVTTDSFPGKTYPGWVGFISPTAEFTPKNVETPQLRTQLVYQVRVFVRNPGNELGLGMPATVTILPERP